MTTAPPPRLSRITEPTGAAATLAPLRLASGYRLRLFSELTQADRNALGADVLDSGYCAAVVDDHSHRPVQALGPEAVEALQRVGRPAVPNGELQVDSTIRTLILAGVLEWNLSGSWVTGLEAMRGLGLVRRQPEDAKDGLEWTAFEHARRCGSTDPRTTANRLYLSNRIPVTRRWRSRWTSPATIASSLDLAGATVFPGFVRGDPQETRPWLAWTRRTAAASAWTWSGKLYVSPLPDDLPDALAAVRNVLSSSGAHAVKVGGSAAALLRPDKCVLYFSSLDDLYDCADRLSADLTGMQGQGVPFTASITGSGLLSWGADPPEKAARIGRVTDASWRVWVCNRLATAMHSAVDCPDDDLVWDYARARLEGLGVDVQRWAPTGLET